MRRRRRPDARYRLDGAVLADTGTALVMRADEAGVKATRPVLVMAQNDVDVADLERELRRLAEQLNLQRSGIRAVS